MLHVVLTLAIWGGSEWAVIQSEMVFRKQDSCQFVANKMIERLKQKNPEWTVYWACTEKTNV